MSWDYFFCNIIMDKNCPVLPRLFLPRLLYYLALKLYRESLITLQNGIKKWQKNKMTEKEIKLESMQLTVSVTSISMELKNWLVIFILHRKTVEGLLLQSNIRKGNYCLKKVIKVYLKRLNRHRPQSVWFKSGGNAISETTANNKWKKNYILKGKIFETLYFPKRYFFELSTISRS